MRGYEQAGAVAIQLEDQEFPKKCGHMLGRRVVPLEDMVAKIRVAADSRSDANFLLIARTDARTTLGLDEALRRAEAYLKAGADLLFIESPESVEEMERIGRDVQRRRCRQHGRGRAHADPPLPRNSSSRLSTGNLSGTRFSRRGRRARKGVRRLKERGSSAGLDVPLYPFQDFSKLMGFDWVAEFDGKYRGMNERSG